MVNKFMHNKVVHGAGLFIVVTSIENVQVLPAIMNNPDIFINVRFQCLVFTLSEGETLVGKITECSSKGLSISLGFFRNIFIEAQYLPDPSKFESNGRRWLWIKKIGIDEYCFSMNNHEEIRFKILETKFNKFSLANKDKAIEPMLSKATIKQDLLGPLVWWS